MGAFAYVAVFALAWLDVLQQLLLLLPAGRPRIHWLMSCDLEGLLMHLLFQSSLPLCRPLLVPLLLDALGAELQPLDPCEAFSIPRQQQQQQLTPEKLAFSAAAAGALADGLYMTAYLKVVEEAAVAEQQTAAGAASAVNEQPLSPTSLLTSSSFNSSRTCLFQRVASVLGNRETRSGRFSNKASVSADVLQLLLLEKLDGDAAGGGKSSDQLTTRLRLALLSLIALTTKEAAAAASAATTCFAETRDDSKCRSCSPGEHLFGALLLLACPQQSVTQHFCALVCRGPPAFSVLLLQPDCIAEAVSLSGPAARSFLRSAATQLLLQQQQQMEQTQLCLLQQKQQQLTLFHAAACLIDMYELSLLEECCADLQREGRGSSLLLQRMPFYRQLLLQRLYSVSAQQRQEAAAALRQSLHLPAALGSDPVGQALRLWQDRGKAEWSSLKVSGLLWEEEEVALLCAAASNDRLSVSTRAQSLHTLLVYIHSNAAEARPFLRRLCVTFLSTAHQQQLLQRGSTGAAMPPEVNFAAEDPLGTFLWTLLQLLSSARPQHQQPNLLALAAQTLAMPLLSLSPLDKVLQALVGVYRHLLGNALLQHSLCGDSDLSLSCLQLYSALLFHPQQSMLLQHRVCPIGSELEALLGLQQQQQQALCLLVPAWLSLRVELPLPIKTLDVLSAAQTAWMQRSEDAAFLVARQLSGNPAVLQVAAAAAAVASACHQGPLSRRLFAKQDTEAAVAPPQQYEAMHLAQEQQQQQQQMPIPASNVQLSKGCSEGVGTGCDNLAAAVNRCFLVPFGAPVCSSYPVLPVVPTGSSFSSVAKGQVAVTLQVAQRLLDPAHPDLSQLLQVLCCPPLVSENLPARRHQPLAELGMAAAPPAAAATAAANLSSPVAFSTYTEALQCTRAIVSALQQLPEEFAARCCCCFSSGRQEVAPTRDCCSSSSCYRCHDLPTPIAKGLRALALAVKRHVYTFLQQVSEKVAETLIEEQESHFSADGMDQQYIPAANPTAECQQELDMLLLGTQLLVELLPLAAAAAAPPNQSGSGGSSCSHHSDWSNEWFSLPNVSEFCGSLLGVSTQLPLLRRVALQLAVLTLEESLPSRCYTRGGRDSDELDFFRVPADELWMQQPTTIANSSNSCPAISAQRSNSSILLQLQLQQLLQLACRLTPDGDVSLQNQQPLAHALLCLDICVRRNSFAAVAATAAEAEAEWGEAAAAPRGSFEQQQQLLESQLALLQGSLRSGHPGVRIAAWRCLRSCLHAAADMLQQNQQQHSAARSGILMRFYSSICPTACQILLSRQGPLPGGFCSRCPSSIAEVAAALRCLSALRCCSRNATPAAGERSLASVAAAADALDEWTSSEAFVHLTLGGFLACNVSEGSSGYATSSVTPTKCIKSFELSNKGTTVLRGLTAALELLCCASKSHAGLILSNMQTQQPVPSLTENSNKGNPSNSNNMGRTDCCSGSILSRIIRGVSPKRRLLPLHHACRVSAAAPAEKAAALAAAVAAVGTEEAEAARVAALAALQGSYVDLTEMRKCCRALLLLLHLMESTNLLSVCLGSSGKSRTLEGAAAGGSSSKLAPGESNASCVFPLFHHIEELVESAALLLLLPAAPSEHACSQKYKGVIRSKIREEVAVGCMERGGAAEAGAAGPWWRRDAAEAVRELLLLLLRLFALLHPQTARRVAKQLDGETSPLGSLLLQQEEMQQQRRQQLWTLQQPLDSDLLQTLYSPQKTEADASEAAARKAARGLWASPVLWLLISCCLQVSAIHLRSTPNSACSFDALEKLICACCVRKFVRRSVETALTAHCLKHCLAKPQRLRSACCNYLSWKFVIASHQHRRSLRLPCRLRIRSSKSGCRRCCRPCLQSTFICTVERSCTFKDSSSVSTSRCCCRLTLSRHKGFSLLLLQCCYSSCVAAISLQLAPCPHIKREQEAPGACDATAQRQLQLPPAARAALIGEEEDAAARATLRCLTCPNRKTHRAAAAAAL